VSIIESSDAVNAGMARQTEGRRLALRAGLRSQIFGWLVDFFSLSQYLAASLSPYPSSALPVFGTFLSVCLSVLYVCTKGGIVSVLSFDPL
jgi:hypothetical protein